jgi:putative ABC transport system permease protein
VLEQGMIYAIMGLGVYITYTILDFPDLTVDGSFPLGASIGAAMISRGMNPLLAIFAALAAGAVVGTCTGIINVKFKVRDLLSGIIMMTALYTVHIRIAGRANLPIYGKDTIFSNSIVNSIFQGALSRYKTVIIIFVVTLIVKLILDWYMSTKSGFMLRAVGDNETIVTSMGVDKGNVKILGLAISNALVTMSGCIFAQQQRYYDAAMGPGTVVIGLASVIIGATLFKKASFLRVTTSVVIGSIIYKACVAIALKLGLPSTDLKMITAVLFLIILIVSMDRRKKRKDGSDLYYDDGSGDDPAGMKDTALGQGGSADA